ncbi:MAG: DUF4200 domain-containing protein [Candidatus Riflebacteria bacterium]|nr:DUF4200 domain-containing protein [Candidatus Riflebacteria bacterium]
MIRTALVVACLLCLSSLLAPLDAQTVNPQAGALFKKALDAAAAQDWTGSVENLRQASQIDQGVWGLPDNGSLDRIVGGLKAKVDGTNGDVGLGKNLAWMYFVKGMQKEALTEYRRLAALAPTDPEVKTNIRTLEAWSSATTSSSGSGRSSGGSDAGTSDPPPSSRPSQAAGGEEAGALKESIKKKDEEIASLQQEKEDLQKKIADLEKEQKELSLYKTQFLMKGGSGTSRPCPAPAAEQPARRYGCGN